MPALRASGRAGQAASTAAMSAAERAACVSDSWIASARAPRKAPSSSAGFSQVLVAAGSCAEGTPVFKTGSIDRSDTLPCAASDPDSPPFFPVFPVFSRVACGRRRPARNGRDRPSARRNGRKRAESHRIVQNRAHSCRIVRGPFPPTSGWAGSCRFAPRKHSCFLSGVGVCTHAWALPSIRLSNSLAVRAHFTRYPPLHATYLVFARKRHRWGGGPRGNPRPGRR